LALLFLLPTFALSQAPFYQGKTITIIQGRSPGGTGDMRVRAVIPLLQKYIPGKPTIVSEYMDGGGGRKAANHMYRGARSDGLTIANIGEGFVANAVLGEPGVQYDIDKFIYLGSGNSRTNYIFHTIKEAKADTLERLRAATGIRIGGQTVGHSIYNLGRLFAWLLDLKEPKFVTGYSGPEIDAAMLRGELDARAQVTEDIPRRNPEWFDKGVMHWHAVLEIPKGYRFRHPVFDQVPALDIFAKTDREKKALTMARNFRLIGSPFILSPGTPKEQVEILEQAMRKTFKDPEFAASMLKFAGAEASPLMPEEQTAAIREIPRDPQIIDVYKKLAGSGPLLAR
jgi:tripartite-type tricarboxylate transporter receptor subunit TctC